MTKQRIIYFLTFGVLAFSLQGQTLEQCQSAAERNYPLIKQYGLIDRSTAYTIENIKKGWLPQVSATAQATYQSDVTAWPEEMSGFISQMGVEIKGLKKDQYRIGLDLSQTIYDGGAIGAQAEVARQQGEVQKIQNEVNLYNVRQRVNEMYFALLLIDKQIILNADLIRLLDANVRKLSSLYRNGAAAECDYHRMLAERMNATQDSINLQAQKSTLTMVLSHFCGIEINHITEPAILEVSGTVQRPELRLIDAQIELAKAQEKTINSALLPKISLFAQGFYGYPGYNMFKDMMQHRFSLNGMVGAKFSWNIGALYTKKNDLAKLTIAQQQAENNRDVFLFNNAMEQRQQADAIERYRKLIATDQDIIVLRGKVRQAAESKLDHGIIEVSELVKEITTENAARVQLACHQIEMLKQYYELKYTTNN